jgi:hypothetical protein
MKYQKFEDLTVWQTTVALSREVFTLTEDPAFKGRHSLRDQIEDEKIRKHAHTKQQREEFLKELEHIRAAHKPSNG